MTASPPSPPIVSPVPTQNEDDGPTEVLELTLENVEMVLDEMRPYLISDGKLLEQHSDDVARSTTMSLTFPSKFFSCRRKRERL